jgi:dTDP-4-dehydrorhamnose reductase
VDDAEDDAEVCRRVNAFGPKVLAAVCAANGTAFVTFSSDLVFDGLASRPYREGDPVSPLSVYGASKADAEHEVFAMNEASLVIRTGAFFGPWDEHNFVTMALSSLRHGTTFVAASDLTVTPTYVPDLVGASLDLLIDRETGLWHLANATPMTLPSRRFLDFFRMMTSWKNSRSIPCEP